MATFLTMVFFVAVLAAITSCRPTPDEADEFLTLEQASQLIPGRPHKNSIRRWMHKGHKGKFLRSWRCGNRLLTSRRAIREFLTENQPTKSIVTSSHRQAEAQLDALGVK